MGGSLAKSRLDAAFVVRMIGIVLFAYFFFGFMLLPCLNTLTSIFTTTNAEGVRDPFAVIRFFFAGSMGRYVWNSLKLAICLVVTVNVVGVSIAVSYTHLLIVITYGAVLLMNLFMNHFGTSKKMKED